MTPDDEPNWRNPDKVYSSAVLREQARVENSDALVFVFPVWWRSVPAMTKGCIDRVFSNGWAYGGRKLRFRKALLLRVAASDADQYRKRGYDESISTQLVTGIMNYCGIDDASLRFLHASLESNEARGAILRDAYFAGRNF